MKTSEQAIFRALKAVFPHPAHTLLSQVRNGTGFSRVRVRTADALAVSTFPSRGLWLAGIEIKTYLGDWKRELANGEKAEEISKYCHRWYVAAPEGLIPQNELPKTWGLIELGKRTKIVVKAKDRKPKPLDMLLLCSILRNVGESCVPISEVEDIAKKEADRLATHRSHELTNLRASITEFEKASGVKVTDRWGHRDIGQAVKIVMQSGITHQCDLLQTLQQRAEGVSAACQRIMEAIQGVTSIDPADGEIGNTK